MENLSSEHHARLTALLDELANRPTYDSLVRSLEVIGVDPNTEEGVRRIDATMAGAWAYYRMRSYLERLRILNNERMEIGDEIHRLRQHPHPTPEASQAEKRAWVQARTLAPHLSGRQEVVINFFASAFSRSARFSWS